MLKRPYLLLPIFVILLGLTSQAEELQTRAPALYSIFKSIPLADFTAKTEVKAEFPRDGARHFEYDTPSFSITLQNPRLSGNTIEIGSVAGKLTYGRLYGKNVAILNVPQLEGGKLVMKEERKENVLFNEKNAEIGFRSQKGARLKLLLPVTFEVELYADEKSKETRARFKDADGMKKHLREQVKTEWADADILQGLEDTPYVNVPKAAELLVGDKLKGERVKNRDRIRAALTENVDKLVELLEGKLVNQAPEMSLGKNVITLTARLSRDLTGYNYYTSGLSPDVTGEFKDSKVTSVTVYNGFVVNAALQQGLSQLITEDRQFDAMKLDKGFSRHKSGVLVYEPVSDDDRKNTADLITGLGFAVKGNEYKALAIPLSGEARPTTRFVGTRDSAKLETTFNLNVVSDRKGDAPKPLPITMTWSPDRAGEIRMTGTYLTSDARKTVINPHSSVFISSLETGMKSAFAYSLVKRELHGARNNTTTFKLLLSRETEPMLLIADTFKQ